jgi:hypothetical protein
MEDDSVEVGDDALPVEKQRQLYFLGMGLYSSIFWIDVLFYNAYRFTTPHIGVVRILAPVLTVAFIILDTVLLRSICRKQFPKNPELLRKWPIAIPKYSTWPYFAFVAMSCIVAIYLLSRL